jgi:soluble lytic murein transglycosylase
MTDLDLDRAGDAASLCGSLSAKAVSALPADLAARGHLLCGVAYLRSGSPKSAIAQLALTQPTLSLLSPYVSYWTAEAEHTLGDDQTALTELDPVAAADAALAPDAQMLQITALRALGRNKEAETALRAWIAANPSSSRLPEAELDLAYTLVAEKTPAAEVTPFLRQILVDSSLSAEADDAQTLFVKLTGAKPQYTAPELDSRGHALFDAMANEEAEKTFGAVLGASGLTPDVECDARFNLAQSVFKERDRARSASLFDDAYKACEATQNGDLQMKAEYQAARGHMAQADYKGAIDRLLQGAKEHPEHSYADDCLLRAAEAYDAEGDTADAEATLATIPDRFPQGDMVGEALFRLAYRHYKKKDYAAALKWLDEDLAVIPYETHYYAQGQALYWKGRILQIEAQEDDARAAYVAAVQQYPLSFYALLSLNRLREMDPDDEAALVAELRSGPPATGWHFQPRALFGTDGFRRGVELVRLGLGIEGRHELAAAGVKPNLDPTVTPDPDQADLLWLVAVLYDRAGDYEASHYIPENVVTDWSQSYPVGDNLGRWQIAYPRAYQALIEPAATREGDPSALVYAITREESAFDPLCVSFAQAFGLMQQIVPTATSLGKPLGIKVTRACLFDPATNVLLGAAEISRLLTKYHGNVALAVPGYNAGDGAVDRWLADHGDEPLDEWAEEIPYDETRNYEKRVDASYFAYQFLYGAADTDPVPEIPLGVSSTASAEAN